MEVKPGPSPQKRAAPYLVFYLVATVMFVFTMCYAASLRASLQIGDAILFAGFAFLIADMFLQWRRYRIAPSAEYTRETPDSVAKQVIFILGWGLLSAACFLQSSLIGSAAWEAMARRKVPYGALIFGGILGMQAVVGLFLLVKARLDLRGQKT